MGSRSRRLLNQSTQSKYPPAEPGAYMRLPESRGFFVVFSDWTIANSVYPAHEV